MKRLIAVAIGVLAVSACSGDDAAPAPIVDRIDDAVEAVEQHYGAPQQFFEISASVDEVRFVVAVDDATAAEQGGFSADGNFRVPEPVGPANGFTFAAEAIGFDPDRIFVQIRDELSDPVIVDFAIVGAVAGSVLYDATVASDAGGALLVRLSPEGRILGVQAR